MTWEFWLLPSETPDCLGSPIFFFVLALAAGATTDPRIVYVKPTPVLT